MVSLQLHTTNAGPHSRLNTVLRPPAPPRHQLPQEEVRKDQPAEVRHRVGTGVADDQTFEFEMSLGSLLAFKIDLNLFLWHSHRSQAEEEDQIIAFRGEALINVSESS